MTNEHAFLRDFKGNAPADDIAIRQLQASSSLKLPGDYLSFLQRVNGGEGFIGKNAYAILWRAEEVVEMNKAYQVDVLAPGLFIFGSDGGGEAFAFDARSDPVFTVTIPFVGMNLELVRPIAPSFERFLMHLFNS